MDIQERRIRQQNRDMAIKLMIPVAILGKLIQYYILPSKYFNDSGRMLLMLNGDSSVGWWSGYEETIEFFKPFNIFGFTSIFQWGALLGIIFTTIMVVLVSRVKEMSMSECVYTLMATGLMNIYVFNLAKEPIQMLYFVCIMLIIMLPIKNTFIKILGCCGIYYWESNTFRSYYIMMAAMVIVLYFIFFWLRRRKRITKFKILLAIVVSFAAMLAFVYASQFVAPDDYEDVLRVRDKYANEAATSAIQNPIEVDGNFGIFAFDYILAAIRMMIPIEMVLKSPVYSPFFVYQIFILVYWIRAMKNIKRLNPQLMLALACFTAYLFGSFVFEPDFGSWVRHEAAAFPIFYLMAYEDIGLPKKERIERTIV
ncbi:MAG: hypothetical protein HFG31_05880 [Eubacterium sp.]|nr:hypothetical protein [Eubacterium sp.]